MNPYFDDIGREPVVTGILGLSCDRNHPKTCRQSSGSSSSSGSFLNCGTGKRQETKGKRQEGIYFNNPIAFGILRFTPYNGKNHA
jgi:hypothetical protein